MKILAIETSCDETAAAVVSQKDDGWVYVLSESVASSEALHIKTGGIVPEVAAREQLVSIQPVIRDALEKAQLQPKDLDALAVTYGPGLIGSLLIGVETAKTLALAWNRPIYQVNHLHGHIYANWIYREKSDNQFPPVFPALALVVSGGHTELVLIKDHGDYELIGATRDDAAGECFDKCARLLGLPYPGGPNLSALATQASESKKLVELPRPLLHDDTFDLSFSGLKAAFAREVQLLGTDISQEQKIDLAAELEMAIVELLTKKVSSALDAFHPKSFLLAGGVAANQRLRSQLERVCQLAQVPNFQPQLKHCVDNATMIGAAAIFNQNPTTSIEMVKATPTLNW